MNLLRRVRFRATYASVPRARLAASTPGVLYPASAVSTSRAAPRFRTAISSIGSKKPASDGWLATEAATIPSSAHVAPHTPP